MSDYLTFEQAAEFLNTSRSTLYRWLREGKLPAHKMGRQWRFLRSELEASLQGQAPSADLSALRALLLQRSQESQDMNEMTHPSEIAERLIWDALDQGSAVIHLNPQGQKHQIRYRTRQGLQTLIELPSWGFEALDKEWVERSSPVRGEHKRRMTLERERGESTQRVQVRYQKVETLAGARLALRLMPERAPVELERIAQPQDAATLRAWMRAPSGLILVSGRSGSGKTTTAYVFLQELAKANDKVIFTIEETIGEALPGVHQVEVDLDDERAYREVFSSIFDSDLDVLFIGSTIAQRHSKTIWNTALSAAESGHLVFVQLEAESAEDAVERMRAHTDLPFDDVLVGASWQELLEVDGKRQARYDLLKGPLSP